MPRSPGWGYSCVRNRSIASNSLSKVILARWIVFKTFIQVAKELEGVVLLDNIQRDWLLFQVVHLVDINGMDPFSALISPAPVDEDESMTQPVLDGVQSDVLEYLSAQLSPSSVLGSSFNDTADSFFYVIDEAQAACQIHPEAFADRAGNNKWPVLHPIIEYMMNSAPDVIKVIVSGTGFSRELFRTLVKDEGVGKDSSMFDVIHTTGDFSDLGTQSLYISRYLPPSFLASDSGTRLKTRIYDWLRGRYVATKVSRR